MSRLLDIDAEIFQAHFNRKPFYVEHSLRGHPLFETERMIRLAKELPPSFTEFNAGNLPVNKDQTPPPITGLTVEETLRRMHEVGSYLIIKWVERDPEYKRLLDDLLDEIAPHANRFMRTMLKRAGFIFISSPGAIAPFHIDHEYNFLLQVAGEKTVHMWDPNDRFIVPETYVEDHYTRLEYRYLPFREEFDTTAYKCPLPAGRGLHFPVVAPHYVRNGNAVSISFSITFRSRETLRRESIYQINSRLRRMGLTPAPYGQSRVQDSAKFLAAETVRGARRLLGKTERERERH